MDEPACLSACLGKELTVTLSVKEGAREVERERRGGKELKIQREEEGVRERMRTDAVSVTNTGCN